MLLSCLQGVPKHDGTCGVGSRTLVEMTFVLLGVQGSAICQLTTGAADSARAQQLVSSHCAVFVCYLLCSYPRNGSVVHMGTMVTCAHV